ncbi:TIR domain-containing protein [Roseateles sp.]|uniref:TIR domain-containing protein n=1 Tax=Roseateles sp. TaxID=1971397 RepID=UPI003266A264
MAKRKIFYSFHFNNDVFRVQQVRNMGVIEGNEPVSPNTWEDLKKSDASVEKWIDDNIGGKSCVVVLIGTETASRKWVKYEIKKAVKDGKGVLGIHVHNLKDPKSGTCTKGTNPFVGLGLSRNGVSFVPKVYDPKSDDAYNDIAKNLSVWVEAAIAQ